MVVATDFQELYFYHTPYLIDIRHTKKDHTCCREGGTTITSFKNIVNTETPITVAQKAQQFP
jgi:hypothetical protein